MDDIEPTIRSRELGEGMRQAMKDAGLTGTTAAYHLAWSPTRAGKTGGGALVTEQVTAGVAAQVGCPRCGRPRRHNGNVFRALQITGDLVVDLDVEEPSVAQVARFSFLLGNDDGTQLFGHDKH